MSPCSERNNNSDNPRTEGGNPVLHSANRLGVIIELGGPLANFIDVWISRSNLNDDCNNSHNSMSHVETVMY